MNGTERAGRQLIITKCRACSKKPSTRRKRERERERERERCVRKRPRSHPSKAELVSTINASTFATAPPPRSRPPSPSPSPFSLILRALTASLDALRPRDCLSLSVRASLLLGGEDPFPPPPARPPPGARRGAARAKLLFQSAPWAPLRDCWTGDSERVGRSAGGGDDDKVSLEEQWRATKVLHDAMRATAEVCAVREWERRELTVEERGRGRGRRQLQRKIHLLKAMK